MLHQSLFASLAIICLLPIPSIISGSSLNLDQTTAEAATLDSRLSANSSESLGGSPKSRKRPPAGRPRPGGGLSGGNQCPRTPIQLTAIMPGDVHGATLTKETSFWIYVPYAASEVSAGEFSLLSRRGTTTVYKTGFTLPPTPGFVKITLPAQLDNFEANQYYQWFLSLTCVANTSDRPDQTINGWVIYVTQPPPPQNQGQDAIPALWYDKVDDLATRLQKSPRDASLRQQWTTLLKELGFPELADKPIVGSVILSTVTTP
ncbi:MAG: DUF928 domain-containing protein [Cyanobacteria bacterium]|nr:DUF928 domain-containing protein [Cyanobacteriota bacterium]MDW8202086.1 DUF928 domain-containing protein [Cyanobacteriota bacterium SKYGB_h_bin112]